MEGSGTPTKLWTGLVSHHKDVFVSHVISEIEYDGSVVLCIGE